MRTVTSKPSAKTNTRILLVDDHPLVREGLAATISREADWEICGEASNAYDALKLVASEKPDLLLVDISLHESNGIELVKHLKAKQSAVKILVSSMHDETLYAERALRAGARGYITKDASCETLVQGIRRVLEGKIYLSERMANRMICRSVGTHGDWSRSPMENLSDRELEVFELIGRGSGTRRIAAELHLSPKTIETYRENIKTKLNLGSGTELRHHAIAWVLENG